MPCALQDNFNLKYSSPLSNHADQFGFEDSTLVVNQPHSMLRSRRKIKWPSLLPSQLSFLLWFVVITKIYACCSTNLLLAIMSLSAQSRDGPTLSDARGKSARGAP